MGFVCLMNDKGECGMAIFQVIKYEGDNTTFVWKHPCEDFNTLSHLIVHESQEAVFFANGQVCDLFGPGNYILETENIPLLRKIINIPTGGESPFHCEVYFINKTGQMTIRWGTDSKVQFMEPTFGFPIAIGASGEMALSVADSQRLLLKLVGTEKYLGQEKLTQLFRAFLMTRVKTYMAQIMKSDAINIFEIDAKLEEFSADLYKRLIPDFLEYGINLNRFFVTTIVKPDGDPQYEKFKELHFRKFADIMDAQLRQQVGVIDQQTASQRIVIEAQGLAQKRQIEGYTYQQERGFDVAEKVAENEAVGQFTNMGVGIGTIAGAGGVVGGLVGEAVGKAFEGIGQDQSSRDDMINRFCDQCGAEITPGALFCDNCGSSLTSSESCIKCGFMFIKPGKFCPKCGTKR